MAKDKKMQEGANTSLSVVFSREEFLASETLDLNKDVVAVVMTTEETISLEELSARVDDFLYRKEVV